VAISLFGVFDGHGTLLVILNYCGTRLMVVNYWDASISLFGVFDGHDIYIYVYMHICIYICNINYCIYCFIFEIVML